MAKLLARVAAMDWGVIARGPRNGDGRQAGESYSIGIIDDPHEAPLPNKSAAKALVCASCDSMSTGETRRPIEQMFGLVGTNTPDVRQ